ncbi:MAG: dicarboxylate/amino acid:cation symporter, partial [Betaproteobacteria bacterium]|nr:dicarboxylate/amino acid:cation symporter [Betaproteobacteria bacterium]
MTKKTSLNTQILFGAITGIVLGLALAGIGKESAAAQTGLYLSELIGTLFIDLLKMVLIPLVFTSIAAGVANLRAHRQMHRVWKATLGFFVFSMALAIMLGMTATNLVRPGEGLQLAMFQDAMRGFQAQHMSLSEFIAHLLHTLFQNPVTALAQSNVLAVVVFALLLGIALVVGGERYANILVLLQELLELMLMLVG